MTKYEKVDNYLASNSNARYDDYSFYEFCVLNNINPKEQWVGDLLDIWIPIMNNTEQEYM